LKPARLIGHLHFQISRARDGSASESDATTIRSKWSRRCGSISRSADSTLRPRSHSTRSTPTSGGRSGRRTRTSN